MRPENTAETLYVVEGDRGFPRWGHFLSGPFSRQGATGPPIHNIGPWGRLGEDPNTWKHFGTEPSRLQTQYSVGIIGILYSDGTIQYSVGRYTIQYSVGRPPGQRRILGPGLQVGGPGKPPFWRTLREFCKKLDSVALQLKSSTHTERTIIYAVRAK